MTSVYYAKQEQRCKRKGYTPLNVETLFKVVTEATIYKFRRNYMNTYQYEVQMPGYGRMIDKSKWVDVKVIGRCL